MRVAVLDTGVDTEHDDLSISQGYNAVSGPTSNYDDKNGHGSHVAGSVAALDNDEGVIGTAKNVDLYAVKAGTAFFFTSDLLEGIDWCMGPPDGPRRVDIVNESLGGATPIAEERSAHEQATAKGTLFVAAAGNEDTDDLSFPAAYDTVMAVAATTKEDELASYSNFGDWVEIAAPGGGEGTSDESIEREEAIYSTYKNDDYAYLIGTSMACPHVAGAAAIVWEDLRRATNEKVRRQLTRTAEDIGLPIGGGLVDVANAVHVDSSDDL